MSDVLDEYDEMAAWLARQRLKGAVGDPLPDTVSETVENLIDDDVEAFAHHVNMAADLLAIEEQRRVEVDPPLAAECAAVANAELLAAKTNGRDIAQSKLALPDLFSPAEISALDPLSELADPLVPDGERLTKAA